jgi:lactosylceramide 4-alpha-galactosyltransferase
MFRVLKKWCNANNLESMDHVSCRGFNILPTRSFHPVDFVSMKELFAQPMVTETEVNIHWLTEDVVGVHVWNRMSQNELVYKNSSQDYTRLARQHCPVIFSIAPEIF